MSWVATAIGAGSMVVKAKADQDKDARKTQLAAATERGSPWTGLHGTMPEESSAIGTVLGGAAAGAAQGQAMKNQESNDMLANSQNELLKARTDQIKKGGSPWDYTQATSGMGQPGGFQYKSPNPWSL